MPWCLCTAQAASARAMQAAYNARLAAVHEAAIMRQEREAQRWRQHTAALARFRAPQVTPSPTLFTLRE